MGWKSGLRILHNDFRSFDTTHSPTTFAPQSNEPQGFGRVWRTFDVSNVPTNFVNTDYQVFLGNPLASSQEFSPMYESVAISVQLAIKELIPIYDGTTSNPVGIGEFVPMIDSVMTTVIMSVTETLAMNETSSGQGPQATTELLPMYDFVQHYTGNEFVELMPMYESVTHFALSTSYFSTKIAVAKIGISYNTTKIQVGKAIIDYAATNIEVIAFSPAPVTQATDPNNPGHANPANPFLPSVTVNGTVLFYDPSTLPGQLSPANETMQMFDSVTHYVTPASSPASETMQMSDSVTAFPFQNY